MATAQGFRALPDRDEDWVRERWRETVRSVLITEQRAFSANALGALAFGVAIAFLPNATSFILPLMMRVLALVGAHLSYNHLRSKIDSSADLGPSLKLLAVMLFFGGMSWAYLLLPVIVEPSDHPFRLLVAGGAMVGVALVVTMTAPLKPQALAFIAGFLLTFFIGLALMAGDALIPNIIGMSALSLGVMIFAFATAHQRVFSSDMLVENQRLNEDLAEALAHSEFLAKHDPLTGLYNRRALFEQKLIEEATQDEAHLLLIDLDHFKKLNDTYGHDTGDRALIAASAMMRDALRAYGPGHHFAVRLGGEEFCMFLDEPDRDKALVFAEDMREALAGLHNSIGLPAGATSASIGLTRHKRGDTVDSSLLKADAAMYDAKTSGRNRVRSVERG